MSYTSIRFIRHGAGEHMGNPGTVAGRSAWAELTDDGISQAIARGTQWSSMGYRPDIVETSPILRCRMTAELALKAAGLADFPIVERPEIAEMCQGGLEGHERTPRIIAEMDRLRGHFRAPGLNDEGLPGESFGDVVERWVTYLQSHADAAALSGRNTEVAVFTHQVLLGTGLGFLALWSELGLSSVSVDDVRDRYMENRGRVPIAPCSETHIIVEPVPDGFNYHVEYISKTID